MSVTLIWNKPQNIMICSLRDSILSKKPGYISILIEPIIFKHSLSLEGTTQNQDMYKFNIKNFIQFRCCSQNEAILHFPVSSNPSSNQNRWKNIQCLVWFLSQRLYLKLYCLNFLSFVFICPFRTLDPGKSLIHLYQLTLAEHGKLILWRFLERKTTRVALTLGPQGKAGKWSQFWRTARQGVPKWT